MDPKKSSSEERWFLDIKTEIRGPLSVQSIIGLLISGEAKVIHRVSRDRLQWSAICNEDVFAQAIQAMLDQMSKTADHYESPSEAKPPDREENTGFTNLEKLRQGIAAQLEHAQKLTELNFSASALRSLLVAIASHKKMVITQRPPTLDRAHPEDLDQIVEDPNARPGPWEWLQNPKVRSFLKISALALIFIVGMQIFMIAKAKREAEETELLRRAAMQAKVLHQYDKAIELFRGIHNRDTLDAQTLLAMAEAHIQTKDYSEGGALGQQALKVAGTPQERAQAHLLIGTAAKNNHDLGAAETELKESIKENSDYYSTFHNLAIIYLAKKDPQAAETLLLKAITVGNEDKALSLLALFEAAMELERPPLPQFERLPRVAKLLHDYRGQSDNFTAEILLAETLVALAMQNHSLADSFIRQFVNLDPRAPGKRSYPDGADADRVGWDNVFTWCLKAYTVDQKEVWLNALIARCLLRVKGPSDALPYAKFSFHSLPGDPDIAGLYTFLLVGVGNWQDAKVILKEIAKDPKAMPTLARNAQLGICEQEKDAACISQYKDLLKDQESPVR